MEANAYGRILAGKYVLYQEAARGGMAEVYRADLMGAAGFRRPVAIKRIHAETASDATFRRMFVEEARVGATLDHPNIVQVYDFAEDPTFGLYLVMEWVEGVTARELTDTLGADADPIIMAAIGIEMLRGLHAAHSRPVTRSDGITVRIPVIHRDLSPSNVMITTHGVVKVADFGLARAFDRVRFTPVDTIKGKLRYMAPEVVTGKPASVRSDLYSCGAVLYELIVGEPLFKFTRDHDIVRAKTDGRISPPVCSMRRDVPTAIGQVVDRAVHPRPGERFGSAAEFARALRAALRTLPARADPPRLAEYVALARGDTPPKGLGDIERLSASLIVSDDEREPEAPARVSKSGSRAKRRGRAGRRAARK